MLDRDHDLPPRSDIERRRDQWRTRHYARSWATRLGNPLDYMPIDEALRELDRRRRRHVRSGWLLWLAWVLAMGVLTYGAFWPRETLP